MVYLMHIGFSNDRRFKHKIYHFEYKGVRFKLIQNNPRRWADVLLTILPTYQDHLVEQEIYKIGAEFLSGLCWENNSCIALENLGGCGWPDNASLRKAKCLSFSFSTGPINGLVTGYGLTQLPYIETENQRIALAWFREAKSSNKDWLAILIFWNILESTISDPEKWLNDTKNLIHTPFFQEEIKELPLNGKSLGDYFKNDCRHAIAHIKKEPGRKRAELNIDVGVDIKRMKLSSSVLEEFAKYFIKNELNLDKKCYLVRERRKEFPKFVTEQIYKQMHYEIAYP